MFRKLIAAGIFAMAADSMINAKIDMRRVEKAIEESNLAQVKSALKKFDHEEMTPQEKKEAYQKFFDLAADVTDEKRARITIFGSLKDVGQLLSGVLLNAIGIGSLLLSTSDPKKAKPALPGAFPVNPPAASVSKRTQYIAGGAICILGGLVLAYRGFTCSTQKGWLAEAEEVEIYLENRISALDDESDETN